MTDNHLARLKRVRLERSTADAALDDAIGAEGERGGAPYCDGGRERHDGLDYFPHDRKDIESGGGTEKLRAIRSENPRVRVRVRGPFDFSLLAARFLAAHEAEPCVPRGALLPEPRTIGASNDSEFRSCLVLGGCQELNPPEHMVRSSTSC